MGELLGGTIIFFYSLAMLKYIFKWINKMLSNLFKNNKNVYSIYRKIVMFFMKWHRIFGLLTVVAIITHFIIQFSTIGLSITGLIAASMMIFQVLLGIYGVKVKNKWKHWIILHRIIAITILIAIIIHIVG